MDDFEDTINKIFYKINIIEEKKVLKVTKKQIIDIYNDNIIKNEDSNTNTLKKINKKNINDDLPKIKKPKNPYMIFCDENRKNIVRKMEKNRRR